MLRPRAYAILCSIALLGAVACSKNESSPVTTTGSGGSGASGGSATSGGSGGSGGLGGAGGGYAGCHPQEMDAPAIEVMLVAQALPTPAGGAIRNGVYHLTAMNRYTGAAGGSGPTGIMWQETVRYEGPEVFSIIDMFDGPSGASNPLKRTFAYQPDDMGKISFSVTCPGPQSSPYDHFTFTEPTDLKIYSTTNDVEWVYELQDDGSGTD